jgi:hypothetical protein
MHRYDDNIRMDIREILWGFVHWIHLVQGRVQWWVLMKTVTKLRVP